MSQIVLTSHLVGYDLLVVSDKAFKAMSPAQQAKFTKAADEAIDFCTKKHLAREEELAAFMKSKGLKVYEPDVAAFRKHAQEKYLASDLAKDWPKGMLEKINAI